MATIKQYEDLKCFQMSRELVKKFKLLSKGNHFREDSYLISQMYRAAISIMLNIGEGFERDGTNEFKQFLSIAKGSCGEFRVGLYIAFDSDYITHEQFLEMHEMSTTISKMINGLMKYLANTDIRGNKFNESEVVYELKPLEIPINLELSFV